MATLYTNGEFTWLTPAELAAYSAIRFSEANPTGAVGLGLSASGSIDLSARLGSVSATLIGNIGADRILTGKGDDAIWGDSGNDSLYGGDGDDFVMGDWDDLETFGDDVLYGGEGADGLAGGLGTDTLYGGDGADTFYIEAALAGSDTYYGGSGEDWIVVDDFTGQGVQEFAFNRIAIGESASVEYLALNEPSYSLTGTDGNDEINLSGTIGLSWTGSTYEDFLTFDLKQGADIYTGGAGRDYVTAWGGEDKVSLGGGDDRLTLVGPGAPIGGISGGSGRDKLVLAGGTGGEEGGTITLSGLVLTSALSFEVLDLAPNTEVAGTTADNVFDLSYATSETSGNRFLLMAGNDQFKGTSGSDFVDAGLGADSFYGGDGDDAYIISGGLDAKDVFFGGTGYSDRLILRTAATIAEGAFVLDGLTITGDQGFELLRFEAKDGGADGVVFGSSGNNVFDLSWLNIDQWAVQLVQPHFNLGGGADQYFSAGGIGQWVEGGAGNDSIHGSAAGDTLDGGTGADSLWGGYGDDVYFIDSQLDVIADEWDGNDTVRTSLGRFQLSVIENVEAIGKQDFTGIGNWGDNRISGDRGNDTLDGVGGHDSLFGGAGNDRLLAGEGAGSLDGGTGSDVLIGSMEEDMLIGGDGADRLVAVGAAVGDGGLGLDSLFGGAGNDTLVGGTAWDSLEGGDGNDLIYGGEATGTSWDDGIETLNGGTGADTMVGGSGDDVYYLDNLGDVVIERADGGFDFVIVTGGSYVQQKHIEQVAIEGDAGASVTLTRFNDYVLGAAGNDTIFGLGGNDRLFGEGGTNWMYGGTGDDVYYVSSAQDVIVEDADGGYDEISATVSGLIMADNVEKFSHMGRDACVATGNSLDNMFVGDGLLSTEISDEKFLGMDGNDVFIVGGGADTLIGGAGDDGYALGGLGTEVAQVTLVEEKDGGIDRVTVATSFKLGANFENLWGYGFDAMRLEGNALANKIAGDRGDDTLVGGGGNDSLTGEEGADVFFFAEPVSWDVIVDFHQGEDRIGLNAAAFGFAGMKKDGALSTDLFKEITSSRLDRSDRVLYDRTTGEVFFDSDGSGAAAAVKIAELHDQYGGNFTLSAADFYLYVV